VHGAVRSTRTSDVTCSRMPEIPNLKWYSSFSKKRGVAIRCPFATVEACPRYYQSLSLLGSAGGTRIPQVEDERLLENWKKSDLWPRTEELATAIAGADGKRSKFTNFCPEVAFDRFGYFATCLGRYGDEIDIGLAHEQLGNGKAPPGDPRWSWASTQAQHYTECPIYAVLDHRTKASGFSSKPSEPWWRRHLAELIVGVVVALVTILVGKLLT